MLLEHTYHTHSVRRVARNKCVPKATTVLIENVLIVSCAGVNALHMPNLHLP